MAEVLFALFLISAATALIGVFCTLVLWERLEHVLCAGASQLIVSATKVFACFAGFFSSTLMEWPPAKLTWWNWLHTFLGTPWNRAVTCALLSIVVWEAFQVLVDWKSSCRVQELKSAEQQAFRCVTFLTSLRMLVNQKKDRINRALPPHEPGRRSVPLIRNGLKPSEQITRILEQLAFCAEKLCLATDSTEAARQNFRVGLYVEESGVLTPYEAIDIRNRYAKPFASFEAHEECFDLNNQRNPSQAVRCLQERRMLITPDCARPPKMGGFEYFEPCQAEYLKSMVAYPILDFRNAQGKIVHAALLIDTDVADFFREQDREIVDILMREFADRLNMEAHVLILVGREGKE